MQTLAEVLLPNQHFKAVCIQPAFDECADVFTMPESSD